MFQTLDIVLNLKFVVGSFTIYYYYFVVLAFVVGFLRFLIRGDK